MGDLQNRDEVGVGGSLVGGRAGYRGTSACMGEGMGEGEGHQLAISVFPNPRHPLFIILRGHLD